MNTFKLSFKSLDSKLQTKSRFNNFLAYVEKVTGIPRTKLILGFTVILILYIIFGPYAIAFVNFIGFIYPAYESLNMIESREKDEDIKWMTYWTVYSYLFLLEFFMEKVLVSIPFYAILKCAFLICCMIPDKWNLSIIIYKHIIKPLIIQNKTTIDNAVTAITNEANEFLTKVK